MENMQTLDSVEQIVEGVRDTPSGRGRHRRSSVSLASIKAPVTDELKIFKRYFREAMRSDVGLLDKITQYVLRLKGKQIRPIIVLLSAKACGQISESSYRGAALGELLHTATLVHDDVVDEAERRRGAFSINALWKNKIAVLFGDFLLSKGLLMSLDHQNYELLHTMSDAVRRMSEGELLQIEKSRRLDIDEETYFRIISDKTASLFASCTASGAISAGADKATVDRLRQFGEKVGLAFQIRDDLFDYGVRDVGKPLGIDIKERKMTLPLIFALRNADKKERKAVLKIVRRKKKSQNDLKTVTEFVRREGGLEYASRQMYDLADEARELLYGLDDSPARQSLDDIVEYIVARKR
ncbi:MAG: polyprenyl synthetase family protein [Rhodothermales bacterium]|nr:polyprenyl synthetase family protein [Rhodothermales bacterium]